MIISMVIKMESANSTETGRNAAPSSGLELATEAAIWGFPRMLYAKYLRDFEREGAAFNRFYAMDCMATPNHGGVNVDTLYGVAWLDVATAPVVLDIPDAAGRYYSIQMVDVYAHNFAYLGRRTTGTGPQRVAVAGPGWQGALPAGMALIRAPSKRVFCFLRTLVDDAADVQVANDFHGRLAVARLSEPPEAALPTVLTDRLGPYFPQAHSHLDRLGARYFDALGEALKNDPPTGARDLQALRRFERIGIGPGRHPAAAGRAVVDLLEQALGRAMDAIFAAKVNIAVDGWSCNRNFDDGEQDALTRAAVNRRGLGMVGIGEAVYLMPAAVCGQGEQHVHPWESCGPDGRPLSGTRRYRLRFPAGQLPPVGAFWSLTLYDRDLLLVDNPIGRYALGDRTPGLEYGPDGSLEVLIQHEPPERGPANWLPAPPGEFQLMFRGYQPSIAFQRGDYRLPRLEIAPAAAPADPAAPANPGAAAEPGAAGR